MKLLIHCQQCIVDSNRQLNPVFIDPNPINDPTPRARLIPETQAQSETQGGNYFNFCSYSKRRLFTHIRSTMNRNILDRDIEEQKNINST